MIIRRSGLSLDDLFISHTFVGSIFIDNGWSLALNNFGANMTGMRGQTCYVRFDWDIEKFMKKYGTFSKFGGTAECYCTSWQDYSNTKIICYRNGEEGLVEVYNKVIDGIGGNAGTNRVNFEIDLSELDNVSLVRFDRAAWCSNRRISRE